jgi:hypothetical protein
MDEQPDELTAQEAEELLNNYHRAFREEFDAAIEESPDNVEELTRDFFKENAAMFAAQIAWLACKASSESVKLQASKIGLQFALEDSRADGDPVKELIRSLQGNKSKSAATSDPS